MTRVAVAVAPRAGYQFVQARRGFAVTVRAPEVPLRAHPPPAPFPPGGARGEREWDEPFAGSDEPWESPDFSRF